MKRTAYFISDGTGITASALGNSLLAQFPGITFDRVTLPYITTPAQAQEVVNTINQNSARSEQRPIVFDTLVNADIRQIIRQADAMNIDVFSAFLAPLEQELDTRSSYSVGRAHAIKERGRYSDRIEAVNFAMQADDGSRTNHYEDAQIILVGVSRCGKTPTCLYMAMQFGIRAANFPITEDDLEFAKLPAALAPYRDKLFGLTIDPLQLAAVRHERRPDTRYASLSQCEFEVDAVEKILLRQRIPHLNSTNFSVEELATKIMSEMQLSR